MTLAMNHPPRHSSITPVDRAAQALGFFSIGLGLTELLFPDAIGRAVGLEGRKNLLRAYGVREIASGIAALQPNPAPAIWARVAGDLLDLGTLAQGATSSDEGKRRNANIALAAVSAITVVDILVATALTAQKARPVKARDYSARSGFPSGAETSRGAMANYTPRDYQVTPRVSGNGLAQRNSGASSFDNAPA